METVEERAILPRNVIPAHYDLKIEPHLQEVVHFDGIVIIDLDVAEQTSAITLNADHLQISKTEIVIAEGDVVATSGLESDMPLGSSSRFLWETKSN
jgi:aminopeptidase 2